MKKINYKSLLVFLAVIVFLGSCTIEKRRYMSGYHVEWFGNDKVKPNHDQQKATEPTAAVQEESKQNEIAPADNSMASVSEELNASDFNTAQVAAPVAPSQKIRIKDVREAVKTIKEVSKANAAAKENTTLGASSSDAARGDHDQLIALILCIVVGGLGIHRFYMGYMWQGIVQLLTAGGCGIWWIIDLIRLITGDLKPADGTWEKEL